MLPVALASIGAGLDRNTVLFVGWFGPRGLASLVFALLALEALGPVADRGGGRHRGHRTAQRAGPRLQRRTVGCPLRTGRCRSGTGARRTGAGLSGPRPGAEPHAHPPSAFSVEAVPSLDRTEPSAPGLGCRRRRPRSGTAAVMSLTRNISPSGLSLPRGAVHYGKARQGLRRSLPVQPDEFLRRSASAVNAGHPSWWTQ